MAVVTQEEKIITPLEKLGFTAQGRTGEEVYGDCPFCFSKRKLYVNTVSGKWHCKAGKCNKSGNQIGFLEAWHAAQAEWNEQEAPDWAGLAKNRGIPSVTLKAAGIVWDGEQWAVPTRNPQGRISNIRFYKLNGRLMGIKFLDLELYGASALLDPKKRTWPVWLVEGEWDAMALAHMAKLAKKRVVIVAVPGSGTFKAAWAELLTGRDLTAVYDADNAGKLGLIKAFKLTHGVVRTFRALKWPESVPDGFDVRDFLMSKAGTFADLESLTGEFIPEDDSGDYDSPADIYSTYPAFADGTRPTFAQTLKVYRQELRMTPDMVDGLRIIYAGVISNQIPGDPLWIQVVAPPGASKTELLMSCSEVTSCVTRSSITVHSLVSGFVKAGGKDPSLLPKLFGRTFILKDWTEVLNMPQAQRHEVYGIFRGAYDGEAEKTFGNGVERIYKGYFSMLAGVTPAVYRESGAALGERFLLYHMQKGTGWDASEQVRAAFNAVGGEVTLKENLKQAAKAFLEVRFELPDELPEVAEEYAQQMVALAQLVAMLRANVEKDFKEEKVLYRPQHELGTRLVKQFKKLILSLGLQNTPPSIGDEEYRIVQRVALDTCVGWNLDTLLKLVEFDGMTADEISERADIPKSTLFSRLSDLCMLGVLEREKVDRSRRGRPPVRYLITPVVKQFLSVSGLLPNIIGNSAHSNGRRAKVANKNGARVTPGNGAPADLISHSNGAKPQIPIKLPLETVTIGRPKIRIKSAKR